MRMGRMMRRFKSFIKYTIQYACITHCFFEHVGDFVVCNGPSMEPTLYTKNVLFTERISKRFHRPHRGDIIIAISPTNPTQYICKRIVGIPGDKILSQTPITPNMKHDHLIKPGRSKENDIGIIKNETKEEFVPRGFVWIEGDNSANSSDSRYYGPIPMGLVKSRVVCRLWPPSEIRLL